MVFASIVRAGYSLFPALQFFPPVVAQDISPVISSAPISSLRRLSRSAGYIFDGTVLSVERVAADSGSVDTVQITFRVEQAIRGVRNGQMMTIREWGGLWNSANAIVPGNACCCFFTSPATGPDSPVEGSPGRIRLTPVEMLSSTIFRSLNSPQINPPANFMALARPPLQTRTDLPSRARVAVQNRISTRTLALAIQRMAAGVAFWPSSFF